MRRRRDEVEKLTSKTNSIVMNTFWSSLGVDCLIFKLILERVTFFQNGKQISFSLVVCLFFPLDWLTT